MSYYIIHSHSSYVFKEIKYYSEALKQARKREKWVFPPVAILRVKPKNKPVQQPKHIAEVLLDEHERLQNTLPR